MTIYMRVNTLKSCAATVAFDAISILAKDGIKVIVDSDCAFLAGDDGDCHVLSASEAYNACDMVLCIGGDGTILHTARHAMLCEKPILGINTGRLGFLAVLESNELESLHCIAKAAYSVENRAVLQAKISGEDKPAGFALNDIVLFKHRPEKTITLDILCDDVPVSRFRGDGVIFATPTGSTAYSMSAGGPIVDAKVEATVVTQICAHIVQTPPLVFSANRVLKAVHAGTDEEQVCIICDGTDAVPLKQGKTVEITKAQYSVPLVQLNDIRQLEAIDKKLKGR